MRNLLQGLAQIGDKVNRATSIIHALGNAETPSNPNSTRHVLLLELTFTATGKVSGSVFRLYQLEKWRVTYADR
jgi:myosin heavy subunit